MAHLTECLGDSFPLMLYIKTKKPIPVFEVSAIQAFSISFPNTGGMAVSSHALAAIFLVHEGFRKRARRSNLIIF